jgi:glyceraldehyde-3-phosphate dehydrogenase (NAD(P))
MGFPSHHAVDVKTIFPNIRVSSLAGIAPMTLMHGHMLFAELESQPSKDDVLKALAQNSRIRAVSTNQGYVTTAQIKDYAEANGRRGNTYEACIWNEGIGIDEEGELGMHLAIDQQAIVVPENIDAIRSMFNLMGKEESIEKTDASLGIKGHKKAMAISLNS